MLNDHDRNKFYADALAEIVTPESIVVEIGTGSGVLSMIAARLGAKHVTAIEANDHLAAIATANFYANGLASRITVINKMSTEVTTAELPYGRADILVSEILGTLLLSENALEFTTDARENLLKPDAKIVPAIGTQCVTLVQCDDLESITTAKNWGGFDLQRCNELKDTASVLFTNNYGFRFSSVDHLYLSDRIAIEKVDFMVDDFRSRPLADRRYRVKARADGVVHAALFSWEVHSDAEERKHSMSTHVEDTAKNLARDMQWGQALQLVEDHTASTSAEGGCPVPLVVTAGEELDIVVKLSKNGVDIQVLIERAA